MDGGHVLRTLRMLLGAPSSVPNPDPRVGANQTKGKAGTGRAIWEGWVVSSRVVTGVPVLEE